MNDAVWLTMRRMRTPLIVLILVYFLSVIGMVLIPGRDPSGNMLRTNFLDAAYFVGIMITTIGFGEIPATFTPAQRLYVFIILFPNVIAWLYSIGTIIGLLFDAQFRAVLARNRFRRGVRRIKGDFYIICGFGNTGRLIVSGLLRRRIGAAILEREAEIVQKIALDSEFSALPALAGDVKDRTLLELAGLRDANCCGVIAITNDSHANLTIAITSKLIRPELPVLARSESSGVSDNMKSFGTDLIVDPYTIFAERFYLALTSPTRYLVQDWLISVPGSELRDELRPPREHWILAGLDRFGRRMASTLERAGLDYTVIDVDPKRLAGRPGAVRGRGTEAETLREAGIAGANGIIAGTDDDIDNLSIIMTARELKPDVFVIARQEVPQNTRLFERAGANLVARRSLITARRILAVATTPLLMVFIDHLIEADDAFAEDLKHRLAAILQGRAPTLWTISLNGELAGGLQALERENVALHLSQLTTNARTPSPEPLPCVCLLLERGERRVILPDGEHEIREGDRLLFAGRGAAHREMLFSLTEPTALVGLVTGRPQPRGAVMRYLARRRQARLAGG